MSRFVLAGFCLMLFAAAAAAQAPSAPAAPSPGAATPTAPLPETNPFSSPADVEQGAALFQTHCTYCHGASGEGGRGADLTAGVYKHGGRDAELYSTIRNGIPGTEMSPMRLSDDDAWKLAAYVKRLGSQGMLEKASGDPAAGKAVYQRSGCGSCHRIEDAGGNLGPELTDIGRRRGVAFLTESLLKPEADVAVGYRAVQVVLKSGQTVSGIRVNRDDLSIQIRDARDNFRSFLMDNVQDVRFDKPTLMPSYASLSAADLGNLIAYLNSLKGTQ